MDPNRMTILHNHILSMDEYGLERITYWVNERKNMLQHIHKRKTSGFGNVVLFNYRGRDIEGIVIPRLNLDFYSNKADPPYEIVASYQNNEELFTVHSDMYEKTGDVSTFHVSIDNTTWLNRTIRNKKA